jgi:hypothetical protein
MTMTTSVVLPQKAACLRKYSYSSTQAPPLPPRRNTIAVPPLKVQATPIAQPLKMDSRYYRPSSPRTSGPILGLDLLRPPGISQNQRRQNRYYDALSPALDVRTQLVIRIANLEPQIRYLHRPTAAKYAH